MKKNNFKNIINDTTIQYKEDLTKYLVNWSEYAEEYLDSEVELKYLIKL